MNVVEPWYYFNCVALVTLDIWDAGGWGWVGGGGGGGGGWGGGGIYLFIHLFTYYLFIYLFVFAFFNDIFGILHDRYTRWPVRPKMARQHYLPYSWYSEVCHITVTSQWAPWRLKSPAYRLLLNRWFRRTSKKTSKPRVTGLCEGNPLVTDGFLSQRVSNTENVPIWWCHHDICFHHEFYTNEMIYLYFFFKNCISQSYQYCSVQRVKSKIRTDAMRVVGCATLPGQLYTIRSCCNINNSALLSAHDAICNSLRTYSCHILQDSGNKNIPALALQCRVFDNIMPIKLFVKCIVFWSWGEYTRSMFNVVLSVLWKCHLFNIIPYHSYIRCCH